MTSITSIPVSKLTRLNLGKPTLFKPSPEMQERINNFRINMYKKPIVPTDSIYAEVKVNGRVMATVSNNSSIKTHDSFTGNIEDIMGSLSGRGPAFAHKVAERLAEFMGGEVNVASTAKTQAQWAQREPIKWGIDTEAMKRHGLDVPEGLDKKQFISPLLASETIAELLGIASEQSPS